MNHLDWKQKITFSHPSTAIELWNKASIAYECDNSIPLNDIQQQILAWFCERIEEWTDSISVLSTFLSLSTENSIKNLQIYQIERVKKAIAMIQQHLFLTKMQKTTFSKARTVLYVLEAFSAGKKLRFNSSFVENSSIERIEGVFTAIYSLFHSPSVDSNQIEQLSLFFDELFQILANEAENLQFLQQESSCKSICENIFVDVAKHYWKKEDISLQIAYLQKGSSTLKSAKLTYESCFVAFERNSISFVEECISKYPPTKFFDEFLHFIEQVSDFDVEYAYELIGKHRSHLESSLANRLHLFELRLRLKEKDVETVKKFCNVCPVDLLESVFMQIWIHAEMEEQIPNFKVQLLTLATELLKRIGEESFKLPVKDLYKRILNQFDCQNHPEVASFKEKIEDFESDDAALNLIQFRLFFSMGEMIRAWKYFELSTKVKDLNFLLEMLLHVGENEDFWEPILQSILQESELLSESQWQFLTKITLNFIGNSRNKLIPKGIQDLIANSKELVKQMQATSKDCSFKAFWNVAVDALNCQNYATSFSLLEICIDNLVENSSLKESVQVCLFVSGVCLMKCFYNSLQIKPENKLNLQHKLEKLFEELKNSQNELFMQYKFHYLLLMQKPNEFIELLQSKKMKFSPEQIVDLMKSCKNLTLMANLMQFLDYPPHNNYIESNDSLMHEICSIFQECISQCISHSPSQALSELKEFVERNPPLFGFEEFSEWLCVTIYNYALFLKDSNKKQTARQWAELAYSLGKSLSNSHLKNHLQAFYISLVLDVPEVPSK